MSSIVSIDTDADGRYVLTGSSDKTAKLWDANSGDYLKTFRIPIGDGQEGLIYASAISPDGSKVAIAGNTGWSWYGETSIYIYDTESAEMIERIGGLANLILDLEFSTDGKYIAASLAGPNGVFVYDANSYQLLASLLEHGDSSYNVEFDNSNRLATVSYDGFVRVYDASFNLQSEVRPSGGQLPFSLSFSPDGQKLAIGYNQSPVIQVLNGQTLAPLYEPDITKANTQTDRLFNLTFSKDGQYLYAGGVYQSVYEGKWKQVMRKWSDAGQGSYVDMPVGSNTIMDVKAYPTGGVIFAGSEPEFGKVNPNDELGFYHKGEINSYRSPDNSHFKLNETGDEIGFTPFRGEPLTFSVLNKSIVSAESESPSFSASATGINIENWQSSEMPTINGQSLQIFEQYERTYSVDVLNNNAIVLGADWNIYSIDSQGNVKWSTSIQSPAFATKISGNGEVVVAAHGDGTIRWYRMEDGEPLLSLFVHPDNRRWITWTPGGYYDASPGAEELIGWYMNNGLNDAASFYPIDRFFETYYRPDLIKEMIIRHETDELITEEAGVETTREFEQPPLVEFVSPEMGTQFSREQATIEAKITDQGGGVDEVRLYHNGKLVNSDTRGFKIAGGENITEREFNVVLLPGVNNFRLTAFNSERIESNPVELELDYSGAVATSDLYVLAIGVNEYKNASMNLNYGKPDAESFVETIQEKGASIFKSINVTTLYDGKANKKNVEKAFQDIIKKAKPEDAFLFFYAGHGVMSEPMENKEEDFYMALHDVVRLYGDNEGLEKNGISAGQITELSKQIKARKQMIVLDACQSGGAVETFSMRGATEQKAILQLARSAGLVVMASTGTEQYATEFQTLGHGVFTYALLQGMQGGADGGLKDGKITVKELDAFINDQVPVLTQKHKGQAQYPNSYSRGQDFPIVISN
jgi:WD40 repeat protein/uncharacterized protein (DUF2164 family)